MSNRTTYRHKVRVSFLEWSRKPRRCNASDGDADAIRSCDLPCPLPPPRNTRQRSTGRWIGFGSHLVVACRRAVALTLIRPAPAPRLVLATADGRPLSGRQASPRAPARLRGSSSPLLACLIPTDLAPVPVPSSAAPGRTHMHAGCTGEELSFSTEPSVLDWDLTSLVVYSSHQALSSLFFLSGGIVYAGQYERAGSSGGGVVPQFVVHTWHCQLHKRLSL